MNLSDAKNKINGYLNSSKNWPLIIDVQNRADLVEMLDYFKIGENQFPSVEQFCNKDGILKVDELYAAISNNTGNIFISGVTGFLRLLGDSKTNMIMKTIATLSIAGHVVVFTFQLREQLKFSDPRIFESGRIVFVDGESDKVPNIFLISPELANAFPDSFDGIQKLGYAIENYNQKNAYFATMVNRERFPESSYHLSEMNNGYDILCERDIRTCEVPRNYGTDGQWNFALEKMGSSGNWSSIIKNNFGSENNLEQALFAYSLFDEKKKWLYFISLLICGTNHNEYLNLSVRNATNFEELTRSIFRSILLIDNDNGQFLSLYKQRRSIIIALGNPLNEIIDYCKVLSVKGEASIYYLTDQSQYERERIIYWLDTYGEHYKCDKLVTILENVYPDLATYLSKYRYKNEILDNYFVEYKYQKVINKILPSFEIVVDEQSSKMDFVSILRPRTSVVDNLNLHNSKAFFVDALGVEYLAFIQRKCDDYGLSTSIACTRCQLPSITSCNKEFVDFLNANGCSVSDIKELDEIKHHGKDNYDYEKEKAPIYLIKELEIIDRLLNQIRIIILGGQYEKAIIISDHGASRLAVLHDTENIWQMATSGEHSGRCCKTSEVDCKPTAAIEESGFWVLANYDRFKGGRKANVEVHGGASIEEVAVPVIEITQKKTDIEAFILEESKVISIGAKEHAIIKIFVAIKSNNIVIKLGNKYYDAIPTSSEYIYIVDLVDYIKKGKFRFDIIDGNDVLATGQCFEIKKKGISEIELFS